MGEEIRLGFLNSIFVLWGAMMILSVESSLKWGMGSVLGR